MYKRIYQFKITLEDISPPIWRRIQVPETYSFWDLHVAIQDAMGWWDSHLHAFRFKGQPEIGIPVGEFPEQGEVLAGWQIQIDEYFRRVGDSVRYEYDFGDGWNHEVLLEGILLKEKGKRYPRCIDGERACPPEDCGGPLGYYELLEIISDPHHEEHEETMVWLGGKYNPERFNPKNVKFDNPHERWQYAFGGD